MPDYERLLDQGNGWCLYQFIVWLWTMLGNLIYTGPFGYMVFAGMLPVENGENGTNSTAFLFNSAAKEFELYGERRWIVTLLTSLFMVGAATGQFSAGPVSDRFGRKLATQASTTFLGLFAVLLYFVGSWPMMGVILFGLGVTVGAHLVARTVLYSELTLQKWRLWHFFLGPVLGYLLLDGWAYFGTDNWRILALLMTVPIPMFILITGYPIQESPKWLIETNRPVKALKAVGKIAKINGQPVVFTLEDMRPSRKIVKGNFTDLWRHGILRNRVIAVAYSYFCLCLTDYGVLFNLGNVAGDVFANYAITVIIRLCIQSVFVVIEFNTHRVGRKFIHQLGVISTFMCVSTAAVVVGTPHLYQNYVWIYRSTCLLSFGCNGFIYIAVFVYLTELFPTVVRTQAAGLASFVGCIGSIIAPSLQLLFHVWGPLPYLILSVTMALNCVVAFFVLPESKGKPLPEMSDFSNGHPSRVQLIEKEEFI